MQKNQNKIYIWIIVLILVILSTIAIIYWLTNKNQSEDQNEMNSRTEPEEDRIDIENEMYEYTDEILGFKMKVPKKTMEYKYKKSGGVYYENPYDNVPTKIFKDYDNNCIFIMNAYTTICDESGCEKIDYTLETFKKEELHSLHGFTVYNPKNQEEAEKIFKDRYDYEIGNESCHYYLKELKPWKYQDGVYEMEMGFEEEEIHKDNPLACSGCLYNYRLYCPEKNKMLIKSTCHEAIFWRYYEKYPFTDSYDNLMIKSFRFL